MKAIHLFLFVAVLAIGGCDMISKNAEEGDTAVTDSLTQVEEGIVGEMATSPIQSFDQAVTALEQGDRETAFAYLQTGINTLMKEGESLEGEAKQKMDTAIADLEAAKLQLQQGQLQSALDLKQLIFNVQVNTPHPLMADMPAVSQQ